MNGHTCDYIKSINSQFRFYTYCHIRKDTNTVFYIGKGCGRRAWNKSGRNRYWKNIANKHGFYVFIISFHASEKFAFNYEKFAIAEFREQLTNMTDGGEGSAGSKPSSETKLKLSIARTGVKIPNDVRIKISEANKGTNNAFYNIIGVNHPTCKGFVIGTNKQDGKIIVFDGARSMKSYGFDSSCITKCIKGGRKYNSHKGFTFIRTLDKNYLQKLLKDDNFYDFASKELITKFIDQ